MILERSMLGIYDHGNVVETSPFALIETPKCKEESINEIAKAILLINTSEIVHSGDSIGNFARYAVYLIAGNETLAIDHFPINAKKYEVEQITISYGENKTELKNDPIINRLINFLSTNIDEFFKKNSQHVDKSSFDCQTFSYYLQHGKSGNYVQRVDHDAHENYRCDLVKHEPLHFYSIYGYTEDHGKNEIYENDDISGHHYVCLDTNVFVSKFGDSDVFFTSYQHIFDAYFPKKFVKGKVSEETI